MTCVGSEVFFVTKKRWYQLLSILLDQSDYISTKKIAHDLNVSERTIYNDIHSGDFRLLLNGATVDIKQKRGIKLVADKFHRQHLQQMIEKDWLYSIPQSGDFSNEVAKILLILFTSKHPTTIKSLTQQMYMSGTSLDMVIDAAKKWAHSYNIQILAKKNYGLYLQGKEQNIRLAFKDLCFHYQNVGDEKEEKEKDRIYGPLKAQLFQIFSLEIVNAVMEIVNQSEINLNERFNDFDYANLVTRLCILVLRNKIGKTVEFSADFGNEIREKLVAELIKYRLENAFHIALSSYEMNEITSYLLSTRRQGNLFLPESQLEHSSLTKVIEKFTRLVSNSLNIDLSHDQELKINLYNHLNPAIRRIRYGIKIENPLLDQIKFEFTNVYIAVMTAIEEIEKNEHIYFDANELGFICLHIVAAINRSNHKGNIAACLICQDGTIASFLKSKIEHQFPEIAVDKIVPITKFSSDILEDFDLIFNTTRASLTQEKSVEDQIIPINLLLDSIDQQKIRYWIVKNEYNKIIHTDSKVRNHILFFKDNSTHKEELLRKYCKFLEIENYVYPGFYQSVIQRENLAPTSLGRGIAIPHGSSELTKKTVILAILLENPIPWDNNQMVDLIFLLALNYQENDDTINYKYFLEKLFYIISDTEIVAKIKKAENAAEIEQIIFDNKNYHLRAERKNPS